MTEPPRYLHGPEDGAVHRRRRTFTVADVRSFGELSGDRQPIHTELDEEGRPIVQGLLTATLLTRTGGELEVLARSFSREFERPVCTGEAITCVWRIETVTESANRFELTADVRSENEAGERVLSGAIEGVVRK